MLFRSKDGVHEIALRDGVDPHDAMKRLLDSTRVNRIEIKRPTLEDVFVRIVTGGESHGDAELVRAQILAGERGDEVEEGVES